MIGFQPYETFQLLVESGGIDRANTLLVAACDAFARRRRPLPPEIEQFEALAMRLFPTAAPSYREQAAAALSSAEKLTPLLEQLVIDNIGDGLTTYLTEGALSDETLLAMIEQGDAIQCALIATRTDLTNPLLAKLFQMNSRRIYRALSENTSIVPRGPFQSAFARSAQMDNVVAEHLANRDDFDAALLAPAFFDLSEEHRLSVVHAFAARKTPVAPIKKTLEQISVATQELTRALMKLFTENRRPEVTRLLAQVTGLDELRCGQIAHDTSGAALFVVLRAFGCTAYDGLKVLIHATSHDSDRSKALSDFAKLFQDVSSDAMAFLLSAWRDEVNLLDLTKPEYRRNIDPAHKSAAHAASGASMPQPNSGEAVIGKTVQAIQTLGIKQAS